MKRGLFHLASVNINHNDFGGARPGFPVITDLSYRNPRPDCQNQIGILNGPVSGPVTHVPRAADIERVLILDQIGSVPIGDNRNVQLFKHRAKSRISAGKTDTVSGMENRALGLPYFFQDRENRLFGHRGRQQGIILRRVITDKLVGFDKTALIIDGNIDPGRTGAPGRRQMPGLLQRMPDHQGIFDHDRVLGHRRDGLYDIILLIAHGADLGARFLQGEAGGGIIADLSADHQHGDGIQPSADHAGQSVGSAGTCCDADGSNAVVQPGIGLGGHGAGLFMVIVSNLQHRVMTKSVIQVHGTAADNTEDIGYTFRSKKVSNIICQSHFHLVLPPYIRSFVTASVMIFAI